VGSRREASFTNLVPGHYSIHVTASNNDGVWNETGAVLKFTVTPAWYQSNWFLAFCVVVACVILTAFHRFRVGQVSKAISARFDERLAERTRIARELHDTFLQTIQGSKLVADDALDSPSDSARMRRAIEQLSIWLGQATEEGRAALNSLRASATERNDLAEAFRRALADCRVRSSAVPSFSVVGKANEMHPIVRDEVFRIGYEAIRNACTHSHATQVAVQLTYASDLTLRVKDNGIGIDPSIVNRGKSGHFGLQGMRERAARILGRLKIVTASNSGTEIELVVPGKVIFRKPAFDMRRLPAKIKSILKRSDPNTFQG
jgi:signal transduction histidine kinase